MSNVFPVLACQKCGSEQLQVVDTRPRKGAENMIWRRRRCIGCGNKFNTVELHQNLLPKDIDISNSMSLRLIVDINRAMGLTDGLLSHKETKEINMSGLFEVLTEVSTLLSSVSKEMLDGT